MSTRIEHTAGAAVGWLVVLGVVAGLAPEAARQARELATEVAQQIQSRLHRGKGGDEDLAQQIREMRPASAAW